MSQNSEQTLDSSGSGSNSIEGPGISTCGRNGNSTCYVTGSKCLGTLEIVKEFNKLYEGKMKEIDEKGGGDCVKVCCCGHNLTFWSLFGCGLRSVQEAIFVN